MRYDIARRSCATVRGWRSHHVGGYLKIAPEHTEEGPLSKMMKPGMVRYDRFKELLTFINRPEKRRYLIRILSPAHPGTRDEDMVNLARCGSSAALPAFGSGAELLPPVAVGEFVPACITPVKPVGKLVIRVKMWWCRRKTKRRRLQRALRYHDPANWPLIRPTLKLWGKSI